MANVFSPLILSKDWGNATVSIHGAVHTARATEI